VEISELQIIIKYYKSLLPFFIFLFCSRSKLL